MVYNGELLVSCMCWLMCRLLLWISIRFIGKFIDRFEWMVEFSDMIVVCVVFFRWVCGCRMWFRIGLLYLDLLICRNGVFGEVVMVLFSG